MLMFDEVPSGPVNWEEFLQYCEFSARDYDNR
jgi:hypothetical protein